MKISSEVFLNSFRSTWNETLLDNPAEYLNPWYFGKPGWTKFMMCENGICYKMLNDLRNYDKEMKYVREVYTVDGLFIGGDNLFRKNLQYPSNIYVLIEHENNANVEEEMWKLIHWRCPLKVIFMYDYAESEKKDAQKSEWIISKLKTLYTMHDLCNHFHGENPETEYLLLVGARKQPEDNIFWKYTVKNKFCTEPQLRLL